MSQKRQQNLKSDILEPSERHIRAPFSSPQEKLACHARRHAKKLKNEDQTSRETFFQGGSVGIYHSHHNRCVSSASSSEDLRKYLITNPHLHGFGTI